MVGAWGSATTAEFSESLLQLRALDWATNSPLQKFPLVTIYHSAKQSLQEQEKAVEVSSQSFATLGYPLFLGALTGMSESPVGVCEKVKYLQNCG
jgi:hypothetical protein